MLAREETHWRLVTATGRPHVLALEHVFRDVECCNFVSEYCEDGTLGGLVTRTTFFTDADARRLVGQVASGVDACHSSGFAHCDVKPANVLIARDGSLKLCDFGNSSACTDQASGLCHRRGTPAFAAPDVWEGSYGLNVDVWSLGVVAYLILSRGQLPFVGNTQKELAADMRRSGLRWDDHSAPLVARDFVQQCLNKDPASRLSIDEALRHPYLRSG
jgi:serine/threonine protein kinase